VKAILDQRGLPGPQGFEAVLQALNTENIARMEYSRTLNALVRIVLDGIETHDR
jgi:hypothetical protein